MIPRFVLASQSAARATLLENAGLEFSVEPAAIDEREIDRRLIGAGRSAGDIALALASAKAADVANRTPGEIVVGADQVMAIDGEFGHKPATHEDAARQLANLSGKTHQLHTAAVIVSDRDRIWDHVSVASLSVRALSDQDIDRYLRAAGKHALASVGGYQIEGPGIQLFDNIQGEYFSILGLPLLPLVKALRDLGSEA